MTRLIAAALLFAVLACGKPAAPPPAKPTPLALAGDAGHVIVRLTPQDTLTDATGTTITYGRLVLFTFESEYSDEKRWAIDSYDNLIAFIKDGGSRTS
ncbi:MAG: hypothetical protein ABI591_16495 [Kofleriaceae bacterium]